MSNDAYIQKEDSEKNNNKQPKCQIGICVMETLNSVDMLVSSYSTRRSKVDFTEGMILKLSGVSQQDVTHSQIKKKKRERNKNRKKHFKKSPKQGMSLVLSWNQRTTSLSVRSRIEEESVVCDENGRT